MITHRSFFIYSVVFWWVLLPVVKFQNNGKGVHLRVTENNICNLCTTKTLRIPHRTRTDSLPVSLKIILKLLKRVKLKIHKISDNIIRTLKFLNLLH